jgi:hypothetical protein
MIASKRIASSISAASLVVLAACSAPPSEGHATARLELLGESASALADAPITSIAGTYGTGCDGRSSMATDTWTISATGGPAVDELSVRKDDSSCVLTITTVVTTSGAYVAAAPIVLDTPDMYPASASAFAVTGGPPAFHGNAKISAIAFAADFTISLLVSDAPSRTDAGTLSATH